MCVCVSVSTLATSLCVHNMLGQLTTYGRRHSAREQLFTRAEKKKAEPRTQTMKSNHIAAPHMKSQFLFEYQINVIRLRTIFP